LALLLINKGFVWRSVHKTLPILVYANIYKMRDIYRSEEVTKAYENHKKSGIMQNACVLCVRKPVKGFSYWKIIPNHFPYDLIAELHEMLVPIRHTSERGLNEEEKAELLEIKEKYLGKYNFVAAATTSTHSIPEHFHLHLIVGKQLEDGNLS